MSRNLMQSLAAVFLATAALVLLDGPAMAAERTIVITAVEPKGGANIEKEPFPAAKLPEGGGYVLKDPDQTGRWEVSVYVFDPRQVFVDEGDDVTLEFVGINGASHPITIAGYDKTFELKRGHVTRITFKADKPGTFPIICATHHPTMAAELIVAPKE